MQNTNRLSIPPQGTAILPNSENVGLTLDLRASHGSARAAGKTGNLARTGLAALLAGLCCAQAQRASAIGAGDPDTMINGFDNTFLYTSGTTQYYKTALNDSSYNYYWVQAIEIQVEEDAYERTGDPARQTKITNLLNSFTSKSTLTGDWGDNGGFNDDLGWASLAFIRGYLMTNNGTFLNQAEHAFNVGYNQGWNTSFNGGGIWFDNSHKGDGAVDSNGNQLSVKTALSNDSLGKAAVLIYQATGDSSYLQKANNIYNWVWNTLRDSNTASSTYGLIYSQIDQNGKKNTSYDTYNQGTFIDFANLLDQANGTHTTYYNDAKATVDYTKNTYYNNGVISNPSTANETWADEFARGLGHFVRDNNLWSTYWAWMNVNANAIMSHRRTDLNITNNGWAVQTTTDNTQQSAWFASAAAWLQYTPATQPTDGIAGYHIITNKVGTNIRIDNGGVRGNPSSGVLLYPGSGNQNEKWDFRLNSLDGSYFITSMQSFQQLDNTGSTANGTKMLEYNFNGNDNQRWFVEALGDGSYRIRAKASGSANEVLDSGSVTSGTNPLLQWGYSGGNQQRWLLQ